MFLYIFIHPSLFPSAPPPALTLACLSGLLPCIPPFPVWPLSQEVAQLVDKHYGGDEEVGVGVFGGLVLLVVIAVDRGTNYVCMGLRDHGFVQKLLPPIYSIYQCVLRSRAKNLTKGYFVLISAQTPPIMLLLQVQKFQKEKLVIEHLQHNKN